MMDGVGSSLFSSTAMASLTELIDEDKKKYKEKS